MKRPHVMFTGTGRAVPKRIMTNHDFAAIGIDTDDAWIRERTGIRQRHVVGPGESLTSLSSEAARIAMAAAGVTAAEVDAIIMATISPDHLLPAAAVEVQAAIGASRAAAFDIDAACTGWIYAVAIAEGLIATGSAETVLVIGGELLTRIVNWKDRNTCVLFGDGAGAAILRHRAHGHGVIATRMGSNGELAELLHVPGGGCAIPITAENVGENLATIRMKGAETFKYAVNAMVDSARQVLDDAGLEPEDLTCVIPHQANLRIINAVAERLELPLDRFMVNLDRFGTTSAAAVAIALDEANRTGRMKVGDYVLLVVFGGGLTWASSVIQW